MEGDILISDGNMRRAFERWDRLYREDPSAFRDFAADLLKGNPEQYGIGAASYFRRLLIETR